MALDQIHNKNVFLWRRRLIIAASSFVPTTDATLTEALWGYGDSKQLKDRVNSVVESLSAVRFCNWMQKVSLRLESSFKINRGPVRD